MDERATHHARGQVSGAADTWPLTALDAARTIGVSERTIRRAIASGDLPATKHAGVYRIDPDDLERYRAGGPGGGRPRPGMTDGPMGLPSSAPPLIGRAQECATTRGMLLREGVRLVTLTGPGGVGKTRIALQLAADTADVFADGAFFVDLSPVRDRRLVLPAIAQAIGFRHAGRRALDEALVSYLRPRELLLVLDNCEQVIEAAPQIAALVGTCPHLQILATSRIPLRLRGEHRLPVDPWPVPAMEEESAAVLTQSDAIRLFLERAVAVYPAFATTGDNLRAIAGICRQLDGLPLAIELAAAWSSLLPPPDLLAQLSDRMRVPGREPRDLPSRHRTVRDTIAWSHGLLAVEDQELFRRLAVFVDGFEVDAAVAIAGLPTATVLDRLGALVDQSLLRRVERPGEEARFAMLETVREFAWQQLDGHGETRDVRSAHARYCMDFAERMDAEVHGPAMRQCLNRLEVEYANCRAALQHFVEFGDVTRELRLADMLSNYWSFRGQISEGMAVLRSALERGDDAPPGPRSNAMAALALLLMASGANDEADRLSKASIPLAREAGNDDHLALALFMRAMVVSSDTERGTEAITLLQEADDLIRDRQPPLKIHSWILVDLGAEWLRAGERERGLALMLEALELFREWGQYLLLGATLLRFGRLDWQDGKTRQAAARYGESLRAYRDAGSVTQTGFALVDLAGLAAACGWHEAAGKLVGMNLAISDRTGAVFGGDAAGMLPPIERQARAVLGDELRAIIEEGRALSPADALSEAIAIADALAMGTPVPARRTPAASHAPDPLSAREHDVLALLVERYTASEIADRLFISARTVERHVANIYDKLGVNSRRAAVIAATEHGLVKDRGGDHHATKNG
jgi:excisionase family DNA binding protein